MSTSKPWYEIHVDPQEKQTILDTYGRISVVLTAKIWSKHPRQPPYPPPEIEVLPNATWQDVGEQLKKRYLDRALDGCDCYSCRNQHSKRGQRERYWIDCVTFALMGDPSDLVKHLKSRRALTTFDRQSLGDLLDAAFTGEATKTGDHRSTGRPRDIAARSCASVALKFYKDWKTINQRERIKDWGHSDAMKDQSCDLALEVHSRRRDGPKLMSKHAMDAMPEFEVVRELMERSSNRRR